MGCSQFEGRRLFLTHIHPYLGHDRIYQSVNELSPVEYMWLGVNTSFKTYIRMDVGVFFVLIAIIWQTEQIGRVIRPSKGRKGEKEEWLSRKLSVYVYLRSRPMNTSCRKRHVSDLDRREWESLYIFPVSHSLFVAAWLSRTSQTGGTGLSFFSYVLSDVWVVSKPSGGKVPFWPFANNLWERKRREKEGKVYWR